jgi:hypothetical protein
MTLPSFRIVAKNVRAWRIFKGDYGKNHGHSGAADAAGVG